jgi:hypothetical protein
MPSTAVSGAAVPRDLPPACDGAAEIGRLADFKVSLAR